MKKFRQFFKKPFLFLCFGLLITAVAIANGPCEEPGQPVRLEVVNIAKNWCELMCTAPTWDGGSPITGYIVEKREKHNPKWIKALETFDSELSFIIPDMTEGSEVEFRIRAKNLAGVSEPSEPTDFIFFVPR